MPLLASITCATMAWDRTAPTRSGSTYVHAGKAGRGVLYGPLRPAVTQLTALILCADRAAASAMQKSIGDLVGPTAITIDPDGVGLGSSHVDGCLVVSGTSSADAKGGLPGGATFLVSVSLSILMPDGWPA